MGSKLGNRFRSRCYVKSSQKKSTYFWEVLEFNCNGCLVSRGRFKLSSFIWVRSPRHPCAGSCQSQPRIWLWHGDCTFAFWEHHWENVLNQFCSNSNWWRVYPRIRALGNREVQCHTSKVVVVHAKLVKRRAKPSHIQTVPLIDLAMTLEMCNFSRNCLISPGSVCVSAKSKCHQSTVTHCEVFPPFQTSVMSFIFIGRLTCVTWLVTGGRTPDVERNLRGENILFFMNPIYIPHTV